MQQFVVGQSRALTVTVRAEDVEQFARLSGDTAPLHLDVEFARRLGFEGRLVHGAFLGALVSRLVGTELPGPSAVLERMDLAFRAPCYAPAELTVTGRVRQVSDAVASVVLDVDITTADGRTLVTGRTWHPRAGGEAEL